MSVGCHDVQECNPSVQVGHCVIKLLGGSRNGDFGNPTSRANKNQKFDRPMQCPIVIAESRRPHESCACRLRGS